MPVQNTPNSSANSGIDPMILRFMSPRDHQSTSGRPSDARSVNHRKPQFKEWLIRFSTTNAPLHSARCAFQTSLLLTRLIISMPLVQHSVFGTASTRTSKGVCCTAISSCVIPYKMHNTSGSETRAAESGFGSRESVALFLRGPYLSVLLLFCAGLRCGKFCFRANAVEPLEDQAAMRHCTAFVRSPGFSRKTLDSA